MINGNELVYELDCDLDTLVCWLQDNPTWCEKIIRLNTKKLPLSFYPLRIQGFFLPPRLTMTSSNSFRVQMWTYWFQYVKFTIVESENGLEIMAGDVIDNDNKNGCATKSDRMRASFHFFQRQANLAKKAKEKELSEHYLIQFINLINSSGLPPARKHAMCKENASIIKMGKQITHKNDLCR